MYIYDYQLEELEYDEEINILKIIGFPVTKGWIINMMIPILTSLLASL